jgi:Type II secretion system (T2SS), protein E, N-terminal domain
MPDLKKGTEISKWWEHSGALRSVPFPENNRELPSEATYVKIWRNIRQSSTSGQLICGNKACSKTRVNPWRNRRRPIFEGSWACSGRCMLSMVQAAIGREYGAGVLSTREEIHQHRVPLGLVLLAQGWLTRSQLEVALESQRVGGGRIGQILVDQGSLSEEQISRGLSLQWGCPVFQVAGFSASQMALVMPKIFIEELGVLPLRILGERLLHLGFEERPYPSLALALEQMTDLTVVHGLVSDSAYKAVRQGLFSAQYITAKNESIGDHDFLGARITAILEDRQPINARMVRVQQFLWLRLWLEREAQSGIGMVPRDVDDVEDYVFRLSE